MDSENFESKYDRNQLYEGDILYCDMAAWRFHGYYGMDPDWEDCYDYSNITDITALRYIVDDSLYDFVEENRTDTDSIVDSSSTTDVYIQHMGDYAISIYFQRDTDAQKEDKLRRWEEITMTVWGWNWNLHDFAVWRNWENSCMERLFHRMRNTLHIVRVI